MTKDEKIALLEQQLKALLEAYSILEQYACELVGNSEAENNEIITHANSIVQIAMNVENY